MAFIREHIPDSDRELVNSFDFKSPFNNMPVVPHNWAVDRERDAFLIGLGGQGYYYSETPRIMVLVWKKNPILIEAYLNDISKDANAIGPEIRWKITRIRAPEILKKDNDMVITLVTQAVEAGGFGRKIPETHFDYIAEPQYVLKVM